MDEGDEDIDPEHDHVYLGDSEWMLRSYYEEVFGGESDEGDSDLEEGFDEDFGDEDDQLKVILFYSYTYTRPVHSQV